MAEKRIIARLLIALFLVMAGLRPGLAQNDGARVFEAETLNAGLAAPPDRLERGTPRDALESFLGLSSHRAFGAAAHLLNLNEIDASAQAARGPKLAQMLSEVIERRVVLDWRDTPGRPDAVDETLPSKHPFAGETRRSLIVAELTLDDRPVTLRLNRVKPAGGEAVWVFASQTVGEIPALHRAFGPSWLEREMPRPLTMEVGGLRVWELIALPAILLLGLGLGLLLRRLIGVLSARSPLDWISRASHRARTSLALAATALILQLLTNYAFSFSGALTVFLTPVLLALMIFGFTFAALRTIDATLEVVTERFVSEIDGSTESERRHRYTSIYALRRYVLLAAVVISSILLLYKMQWFDSFGMSLLASAGVATVILSIAGQSVLGNILASLQIAIAKPIRIGDSVLYEDMWAYVESIYYTFVVLRTWDERRLIVPVKYFISKPFENWTMVDSKSTRGFRMQLDLAAEPGTLRRAFERFAEEDEAAQNDETVLVVVESYDDRTQTVAFYATAPTPSDAWFMQARLAERMGDWVRETHPEWWPKLRLDRARDETSGETPRRRAMAAE